MLGREILAVDLFCGAGGFSEGLRMAGIRSVVGSDINPNAGATYVDNHAPHGTRFVLGDITRSEVRRKILDTVGRSKIDLVVGGPPCQAFSQVRNHDRVEEDPRNSLYRHLMGIVGELEPKVFVVENVVGIQNIGGGAVGARILQDLTLGGRYLVASQVLDASDYGVPQTRRRVVILGIRFDLGVRFSFPRQIGIAERLRPVRHVVQGRITYEFPPEQLGILNEPSLSKRLLDPDCLDFVTVEQAIGDLRDLVPAEKLERKPSNEAIPYFSPPMSAYQRLMRTCSDTLFNADVPSIRYDTVHRLDVIPQGGNFRDIPEELRARYLTDSKWGQELGREALSRKHYYAYRKLHPDYVAWTLNTKSDCVYHYDRPRALSVREFARLHSFPDSYHFMHGDRHSRYEQIGNAVPPLLAKVIAETVLQALRTEPLFQAEPTIFPVGSSAQP